MVLKVPEGAEAAYQVVDTDAWGRHLTIHLYGAGRRGWLLASLRFPGHDRDTGPQVLGKGQWKTFLNLIKQARFWELPEKWPHPWPEGVTVEDGSSLSVAGRDRQRYHRIARFVWCEPGLDQVLRFCRQVCGFSPEQPVPAEQSARQTPSPNVSASAPAVVGPARPVGSES
jgi:hypothetical protein